MRHLHGRHWVRSQGGIASPQCVSPVLQPELPVALSGNRNSLWISVQLLRSSTLTHSPTTTAGGSAPPDPPHT